VLWHCIRLRRARIKGWDLKPHTSCFCTQTTIMYTWFWRSPLALVDSLEW
jgi:hypothetical protein